MPIKSDESRSYDGPNVDAAVARLTGTSAPAARPDVGPEMIARETPRDTHTKTPSERSARRRITSKQAERQRELMVAEKFWEGVPTHDDAPPSVAPPVGSEPHTPTLHVEVDGPNDATATQRSEFSSPAVLLVAPPSVPERSWDTAVAEIRREVGELDDLFALFVRKVMSVADRIGALQVWHAEQKVRDPESVPASFVQGLADAFHRTTSHVEQWLRIFRMDPARRSLISEHPRINGDFTAVLAVARAPDLDTAGELVHAYDQGGRAAFLEVRASTGRTSTDRGVRPDKPRSKSSSTSGGSALRRRDLSSDEAALKSCRSEDGAQERSIRLTGRATAAEPDVGLSPQHATAPVPCPTREVLRLARDGKPTPWRGRFWRVVEQTDAEIVIELADEPDIDPRRPPPGRPPFRSSEGAPMPTPSSGEVAPFVFDGPALDPLPTGALGVVRFTASAAEVAQAVKVASIVEPGGVTVNGGAGYMIAVSPDEAGVVRGRVVTDDGEHFCAATFAVRSVARCGYFAYPAEKIQAFRFLGQEELAFTAYTQHGVQGPWWDFFRASLPQNFIDVVSAHGATMVQHHDLHPMLFGDPSDKTDEPLVSFDAAVLHAALEASLPFLGPASSDANTQFLKLVGGNSTGRLLASEKSGATITFESSALGGTDLTIHRTSAKPLAAFLSHAAGAVEIGSGPKFSFARLKDRTFGWLRREGPPIMSGESAWAEHIALSVDRKEVLDLLRSARTHLAKRRDTIRISYASATGQVRVLTTRGGKGTSEPVTARKCRASADDRDGAYEVDMASFVRLFGRARSEQVELHLGRDGDASGQMVFRTVEEFEIEGHSCRVTRSCACIS